MNKHFRPIVASALALTILSLASITATPVTVNAQSTLQDTKGSLQPQSNATQNSVNTQSQVDTLQTNSGQVLTQNSPGSLGVVSDPKQTTPDAVVAPSETLKTELTDTSSGNNTIYIAVGLVVIATASYYLSQRLGTTVVSSSKVSAPVPEKTEPIIKPEPIKAPKKKKATRKKRKKTQR